MSIGYDVAKGQLAKVLTETFPNADEIDFDVLAGVILGRVDLAAMKMLDQREQALQQALKATMDYLSGVITAQGEHIDELNAKIADLHRSRATTVTTKPSGRDLLVKSDE